MNTFVQLNLVHFFFCLIAQKPCDMNTMQLNHWPITVTYTRMLFDFEENDLWSSESLRNSKQAAHRETEQSTALYPVTKAQQWPGLDLCWWSKNQLYNDSFWLINQKTISHQMFFFPPFPNTSMWEILCLFLNRHYTLYVCVKRWFCIPSRPPPSCVSNRTILRDLKTYAHGWLSVINQREWGF